MKFVVVQHSCAGSATATITTESQETFCYAFAQKAQSQFGLLSSKVKCFSVQMRSTHEVQPLSDMSHHADELDQLQSHGDHHSLAEVVDRSDHLVVAGEQVLHQFALILRAQRRTYRTHADVQN